VSFLAVPDYEGVFISVGNVLTQLVAQLTADEAGQPALALGIPNVETGELIQAIQLPKLAPREPRPRPHHGRRMDLRRFWRAPLLPAPHGARAGGAG
jgi:hypothetical protein